MSTSSSSNASRDGTAAILRQIAAEDKNVKVILNARNFGHIRSPHHAMLQARREAVISVVSDLQDPARTHQGLHQKMGGRLSCCHCH